MSQNALRKSSEKQWEKSFKFMALIMSHFL